MNRINRGHKRIKSGLFGVKKKLPKPNGEVVWHLLPIPFNPLRTSPSKQYEAKTLSFQQIDTTSQQNEIERQLGLE
jgi:hypothetical protein